MLGVQARFASFSGGTITFLGLLNRYFHPTLRGIPLNSEQLYECNPSKPHHGFTCWDDFFTRCFRPGFRPVDNVNDPSVVVCPCQAKPFMLHSGVKPSDNFWIKVSHAPISGTIEAFSVIDGTYFAIAPWVTGFAKPGGQADPLV